MLWGTAPNPPSKVSIGSLKVIGLIPHHRVLRHHVGSSQLVYATTAGTTTQRKSFQCASGKDSSQPWMRRT